nr:early activation antigen CD69-like isoform X3 [Caretta caretta]
MALEQSLNGRQGDLLHLRHRKPVGWKVPLIVGVVLTVVVVIVAVPMILLSVKSPPESKLPHVSTPTQLNAKRPTACCPDGWVGFRGKCYYFSDTEGIWDSSQSLCSSLNASLAEIDTQKDLVYGKRRRRLRIPERRLCHFVVVLHEALLDLQRTRRDAKGGRNARGLKGEAWGNASRPSCLTLQTSLKKILDRA